MRLFGNYTPWKFLGWTRKMVGLGRLFLSNTYVQPFVFLELDGKKDRINKLPSKIIWGSQKWSQASFPFPWQAFWEGASLHPINNCGKGIPSTNKNWVPGDSKWPFYPLIGGHLTSLNHPLKVTLNHQVVVSNMFYFHPENRRRFPLLLIFFKWVVQPPTRKTVAFALQVPVCW